ncbi:MAG: glycerol-3-phosphate acyltransferase [Streptococcus sp.]
MEKRWRRGCLTWFSPILLLILAVYFVASLYLTSMISFSSVTVALLAILSVLLLPLTGWILHSYDPLFTVIVLALATLIILRHKDNIQRIKEKKENLIPWGKNITHQQPKN